MSISKSHHTISEHTTPPAEHQPAQLCTSLLLQGVPTEALRENSKKDRFCRCARPFQSRAGICLSVQQAGPRQAVDAETKRLNALSAQLGRLCQPKAKSGKLDVPVAIYEQWKQAGEPRKLLLSTLIAANGDKEPHRTTCPNTKPAELT